MSNPFASVPLPPTIKIPTFNDTLGAIFIGYTVSAVLFSISIVQAVIYFLNCEKDRLWLKSLVAVICVLDVFHTCLLSHSFYWYCFASHSNPFQVERTTWSILTAIFTTAAIDTLVNFFFLYRIWALQGRRTIAGIIRSIVVITLSLLGCTAALYFGIQMMKHQLWADVPKYQWALYLGLTMEMVPDFIIAISMIVLLRARRNDIQIASTIQTVDTIIMYTLGSGAITFITATLCLITYSTMPNNFIFVALFGVLCRLYVNSMLASLNARARLRQQTVVISGGIQPHALHIRPSESDNIPLSDMTPKRTFFDSSP